MCETATEPENQMSLLSPSSLASLDDSLALAYESLRQLEAAEPIDVELVIRQLQEAERRAGKVRALMSSQHPHASWQNRDELEALIAAGPRKRDDHDRRGFWFLRWARAR